MKKEEIKKMNEKVVDAYSQMINEEMHYLGRLRTCNARVYESEHYYILESYRTIVAFLDKRTDTIYDILRLVYGYTSTSAQHIVKFSHDYSLSGRPWLFRYHEI